ncbi:MAG: hypothetical protein LBO65_00290 [Spirochaetaceae bacterium]|jgi:hypothetical protein|nr:hypothetical protein [Spirochaetaceae bacterium]
MSVRATERLIGDVVVVSGLSNSAKMVVQSINEETKTVTTVWFADDHTAQTGVFPAKAIDRLEQKEKPERKPKAAAKKTGRRK